MNKRVWSFGRFSYLLVLTCGRITECFGEPTVLTNIPSESITFENTTDYDIKVLGIVGIIDAIIQEADGYQYAVKDMEMNETIGKKSTKVVKIPAQPWYQPSNLVIVAVANVNLYDHVQLRLDSINIKIQTGGKNGITAIASSSPAGIMAQVNQMKQLQGKRL